MDFKFSQLKILTLFLSIGIWLLGWTYFMAYKGSFYNNLFWTSMILIGLLTYLIIIDKPEKYKIVYLFIFGTIIYMLNILPSPIHFQFYDELATYETVKLIYTNGNLLNIITHFEMPKYYPGLGILAVIFKTTINLDFFTTARILIGTIHSFLLIFLYLFLKKVSFSERIASIGTFIYATNPLYVYFHSMFSYESLGIFFGICLLYLISKKSLSSSIENSLSYKIVIIIVIASLTITHHLSSLMILLFMILLVTVRYKNYLIKSYKNFHTNVTFLTAGFIFIWMTYIATAVIRYLYGHFIDNFKKIFELSLLGGHKTELSSVSLNTARLPNYELIIDSRIYAPLLVLLSVIGIIILISKFEKKNSYLYVMTIYGPILYIISLGFILTSGQELALRTWGFLYIGVSLMSAITINRIDFSKYNNIFTKNLAKILLFSVMISIIIGGISIGDKPIHREPDDLLHPKLLGGSGSLTTDVFRSAEWFEQNFGKYNNISIDYGTSIIFAYYGNQNPYAGESYKVFFPEKMDENIPNFIKYYKIKNIIVDRRIAQSLGESGAYFGNERKSKEYQLMEYGSKQPLSKKSIEKFDSSKIFYKTYDNGNIAIYNIVTW